MTIRNCDEARPLLMAYIDSELDATTTLSLTAHLARCAECRSRLEAEQQIEAGIASQLMHEPMPREVSERLEAALLTARRAARRHTISISQLSWLAAAALLVLALGLWLRDPGVARPGALSLSSDLVAVFDRAARGPLDPSDEGVDVLARRLAEPRFAGLSLPDSGSSPLHRFHLLGSSEAIVEGVRGLSVSYDCCGAIASVLVLPVDGLPDSLAGELPTREPIDAEISGVKTRLFMDHGLLIGVASRHSVALANAIAD